MSAAPKRESERLAAFLRDDEAHGLDDLHRARLERQLLSAARERSFNEALASGPMGESLRPAPSAPRAKAPRARWAAAGAAVLAAAAAAWLMVRPAEAPHYAVQTSGAGASASGSIEPGTELALAPGETASVELFDLAVNVSSRSRFRVEAVSLSDVRVALSTGEARFAFHPRDRGHQNVAISTPAARIEIVGTELTVRVGATGTEVTVHEGVVRVIPTSGEVELVHAGASISVPVAVAAADAVGATEASLAAVAEPARESDERSGMDEGSAAAGGVEPGSLESGAPEAGSVEAGSLPAGLETAAPSDRERLRQAVALLDRGERAHADAIFLDLTEHAHVRSVRADAWSYLGASYHLRHDDAAAVAAYEHAVELSSGVDRDNALFELATVTEGAEASRAAWARYLAEYPTGSNVARARHNLCELGGAEGLTCP